MLAAELELDEGEVVKSSSDLSVAFLRQEFREEMNDDAASTAVAGFAVVETARRGPSAATNAMREVGNCGLFLGNWGERGTLQDSEYINDHKLKALCQIDKLFTPHDFHACRGPC